MEEVWKDIAGYEGLYQVSNYGNVRSVDRYTKTSNSVRFYKGRLMKQEQNRNGYMQVSLCKNGNYKCFLVHRLVAKAYISNPKKLPEVNHKDENKENNNVCNLEWVTRIENEMHGTKKERQSNTMKHPIVQYNLNGKYLKEWKSASDAEKEMRGKNTGNISNCLNGKTKTAYGYIWKYKEA